MLSHEVDLSVYLSNSSVSYCKELLPLNHKIWIYTQDLAFTSIIFLDKLLGFSEPGLVSLSIRRGRLSHSIVVKNE